MPAESCSLAISAARGEWRGFDLRAVSGTAWIALVYLVFAGSIAGFTAYVWLLHHESPTKVGTYAYVNPVVAVIIGYFLGGEPLGARTVLGGIFVLASVVTITSMRTKIPACGRRRRMRRPLPAAAPRHKAQIHAEILAVVLIFGQLANPFGREAEVTYAAHFQTTFLEGRRSCRRDCGTCMVHRF